MGKEELLERFDELNDDGAMLRKCFSLLLDDDLNKASEFLECYEGVYTYNNYLSDREALQVVRSFTNFDGSKGAKWSPDTLFDAVKEIGGKIESEPSYNKWALYAVMNMEHSDHGRVIGKWANGDAEKYAEACYDLAVSQLTDADRLKFVRDYFCLE